MKTQFLKKSILFLSFLFLVGFVMGQAPEKMSYQSVIRGTNNALITNQNVRVKISILQGTITGSAAYVEEHTTSTNSNGLVSLSIGGGNVISGSFSTINWENGPYFVKMEADPTGGTNYTVSGTSQLLSVPYALYAKTSGSSKDAWNSTGNTGTSPTTNFIGTTDAKDFVFKTNNIERMRVTSSGNIGVGTSNPQAKLNVIGDVILQDNDNSPYRLEIKDSTGLIRGSNRILWSSTATNYDIDAYPPTTTSSSTSSVRLFRNINSTGPKYLAFLRGDNSAVESARIAVDGQNSYFQVHGGNLGIGTNSPLGKLHVNNDVSGSDSSMVFTTQGLLGIGTSTPNFTENGSTTHSGVNIANSAGSAAVKLESYRNSANHSKLLSFNYRGDKTTPLAVIDTDKLLELNAYGYNGNSDPLFGLSSRIEFSVDGSTSSASTPGAITFRTRSVGSSIDSVRLILKSNGRVGIGVTNPAGKFHVNNDVSGSDSSFVVTTGGNVGIGTATPIGKFEVKSSSSFSRKGQIVLDPGVYASPEGGTDVYNWIRSEYVNNTPWDLGLGGTAYNSGLPQVMIKRNGFVGIGTTSPLGKFHVNNDVSGSDSSFVVTTGGNVGIGTSTPTDKLMMRSNDGLSLGFKVVENVNYAEIQTNKSGGSNLILQKTGGYVGIGLTTPISTLGVRDDASVYPAFGIYDNLNNPRLMIDYESNGTSPITNIQFNPITLSDTAQAAIRFFRTTNTTGKKFVVFLRGNSSTEESARIGIDGQNSFFQIHGGNLGIGTNAPNEKLEVNGSAIIDNGTGTIRFHSNSTANYIQSGLSLTNGSSKDLFFGSIYGSGSNFTIKSNGNIGVGTTTPTAKLDVAGTVKIADGTQGAGKVLTSDASGNASWQAVSSGSSGFTNVQVFSTAGTSTFTVPAGVTKIMIEVWGGGGGGGASNPNPGSPGGGGGYGKDIFNVSSGVTYTVTVGAGGSQGISGTAGGTGGTSSVGSLISAVGGSGGASNAGISGSGGTSSARINISGQQGISLGTSSTGIGGSSPNGGYGTRGWGGFPGAGGAGSSPGAGGQVIIWY